MKLPKLVKSVNAIVLGYALMVVLIWIVQEGMVGWGAPIRGGVRPELLDVDSSRGTNPRAPVRGRVPQVSRCRAAISWLDAPQSNQSVNTRSE